ncbi:MAG: YgjV family protein [Oscillospiraceae bacterium]|nr:YgjV family protein [Oscillospiraceae bacterium]
MLDVIIGNVFSLVAMGTDTIASSRKTSKGVLLMQCVSQLALGLGSLVLKGYSAVVQNGVSILRNLRAATNKGGKWLEWVFLALAVSLGLYFNNLGWIGLLPVVANVGYSLTIYFFADDEFKLKFAYLITNVLFATFNAVILNFIGTGSNIFVAVATAIFLIKDRKRKKQEAQSNT